MSTPVDAASVRCKRRGNRVESPLSAVTGFLLATYSASARLRALVLWRPLGSPRLMQRPRLGAAGRPRDVSPALLGVFDATAVGRRPGTEPNAQTGIFRKKRTPSTANAWDSRARCAVLLRSVYSATVKSSAKTVSFRWGSGCTHALVYAQKKYEPCIMSSCVIRCSQRR